MEPPPPTSKREEEEGSSQLTFIREPLHNLREIAKQLLCLEDHICCAERRCHDCIRKHLLYAEALAEEASAMDTKGRYAAYCDSLARSLRNMESVFFGDKKSEPRRLKQALREHRKYIASTYGDAWVAMYRGRDQHT